MDTTVITEIAEYYEKELGYEIPPRTPFVGRNFNVTQAGIHADGLMKTKRSQHIQHREAAQQACRRRHQPDFRHCGYSPLDQQPFQAHRGQEGQQEGRKVLRLKEWVDEQYRNGRVTCISDQELEKAVRTWCRRYLTWRDAVSCSSTARNRINEIALPDDSWGITGASPDDSGSITGSITGRQRSIWSITPAGW